MLGLRMMNHQNHFNTFKPSQLELFPNHINHDLVKNYHVNMKELSKTNKIIYKFKDHSSLVEKTEKVLQNYRNENGTLSIKTYRLLKESKRLHESVYEVIDHYENRKEYLEKWFRDFKLMITTTSI